MPCFPDPINSKSICYTVNNNQMSPSFLQITPNIINKYAPPSKEEPVSDMQLYFAYLSLYILFPLLYIILDSGNQTAIMILLRYIKSGMFDAVNHIKEYLTDFLYGALRTFGQYTFSTYTVVKNGREIYTASSMYFYHKSDVKSVYRIDRAKYNVCKWIDKQSALYRNNNDDEDPEINETHNDIYDFILHKVDNQPYTRIHRGDFTGRTHTLITEHYRPFPKSYQMADKAELTVYTNSTSVEPALNSSDASAGTETGFEPCFMPQTFTINLKTPNHFFLEKNEILDSKFLQWKLYNEFCRNDLATYLRSPFYNYKVVLYYNECMKNYFKENTAATSTSNLHEEAPEVQTRFPAYKLNETQSVIVGHTYVIKVDSILRCPVFESGEKQVFDIDGILTTYYNCSDTESESEIDNDDNDDDSSCVSYVEEIDSESSSASSDDAEASDAAETADATEATDASDAAANTENDTKTDCDDPEFEIIQDPSK
jgi:hypothetical protein